MAWFRVDDALSDHPKVLAAGNAAMGLWVRAGAWSMKHLTDGFIPSAVAGLLGSTREAKALVSSGLWLVEDGGFRFHAWEGRQPTKLDVEERRRVRSEAGRKGGLNSGASRREAKDEANASRSVEANANPVPSRPVPSQDKTDDRDLTSHVTQGDARADDGDEEFITGEFAKLGVTTPQARGRVVAAIRSALPFGVISDAEVVDVAREVLLLSLAPVRYPVAYVEKACRDSAAEVARIWRQANPPKAVA